MSQEEYRRALETATREYEALGEERRRIDRRLGELGQSIATLTRLCGLTPTVTWGLTDACRTVLRGAGKAMTPVELRDRLKSIGFDFSKYTNELAAVHTILKRLNEAGELRFLTSGYGPKSYIWEKPARAAGLGPEVAEFLRAAPSRRPRAKKKETR